MPLVPIRDRHRPIVAGLGLCSFVVSSKQVAAIRGSIMGAGISLVAAMDYVVAPESRSLRWARAGLVQGLEIQ